MGFGGPHTHPKEKRKTCGNSRWEPPTPPQGRVVFGVSVGFSRRQGIVFGVFVKSAPHVGKSLPKGKEPRENPCFLSFRWVKSAPHGVWVKICLKERSPKKTQVKFVKLLAFSSAPPQISSPRPAPWNLPGPSPQPVRRKQGLLQGQQDSLERKGLQGRLR